MESQLPDYIANEMLKIFVNEPSIERVLLFGSRARGDNRYNSDIDIALEGKDIPSHINLDLREAAGLYKLDIVRLEDVNNADLLYEMQKDCKVLYDRSFS